MATRVTGVIAVPVLALVKTAPVVMVTDDVTRTLRLWGLVCAVG